MAKFIVVGDLHLKGTNPRNRIGSYKQAAFDKLREVFSLAKEHAASAIIQTGDVLDSPEVSNGVLLEYMSLLQESPCQIITCSGNHDVYGYNLESLERASLHILELLVPRLSVNKEWFFPKGTGVNVTFQPYTGRVDVEGWGYSPAEVQQHFTNIHVVHGMLLDHVPPFDKYSLLKDVKTNADIVITGHDHTGYGIFKRADGVTFINPGALLRSSASISEIERPIQVALIDVRGPKDYSVKMLPITCAKPGNEVLDRSRIEADQKRAYAMESFAALIQAETGERVLLDISSIVEQIAAIDKYSADVVRVTLERIAAERERL